MPKCGVWSQGPKHNSVIFETYSGFLLVLLKDYEKTNRNTYCRYVISEVQRFYRYAPKMSNMGKTRIGFVTFPSQLTPGGGGVLD